MAALLLYGLHNLMSSESWSEALSVRSRTYAAGFSRYLEIFPGERNAMNVAKIVMNDSAMRHAGATILAAMLAASPASFAQAPASEAAPRTGPASEASPMFQRHHAMAGIMKDMVQEMSRMQEEMDRGAATPEQARRMAAKMKRMSEMMRRMSGWADRPTMKQPEFQRQLDEMRRQMMAM